MMVSKKSHTGTLPSWMSGSLGARGTMFPFGTCETSRDCARIEVITLGVILGLHGGYERGI